MNVWTNLMIKCVFLSGCKNMNFERIHMLSDVIRVDPSIESC